MNVYRHPRQAPDERSERHAYDLGNRHPCNDGTERAAPILGRRE